MSDQIEGNGHRRPPGSRLATIDAEGPGAGHARTRVVIGIRALGFHQEVQDFLGRDPRLDIAGAAVDAERLVAILGEEAPDTVLACPWMAHELRHPALGERRPRLVIVAEEMTVPVLREAVEVGAHAVFSWPEERAELARTLARTHAHRGETRPNRGRVMAVHGARGGAGATFVATHLAATLAGRGLKTVLVDLDLAFSDVSAALGIDPDRRVRTVLDLVPVMGELSPEHVEDALYAHPRGFSVLLAPADPAASGEVRPGLLRAAVALLAGARDAVVLHLPRVSDRVARAGLELADRLVLVTPLDLFSLYGARRTIELAGTSVPRDRWCVVVNKPSRPSLTERDIERILGTRPLASIRFEGRVKRVQERGELLSDRSGGVGRDLRRLAALLLDEPGSEPAKERA